MLAWVQPEGGPVVRYSLEMRNAPLILGFTCGAALVTAVVSFEIWGQVQYARSWDALFGIGLGADLVGAVAGWVAIGLLLAPRISQRARHARGSLSHS